MRKYITAVILLANIFVITFLAQATILAFISQFKMYYLFIALTIALVPTSFFVRRIYRDLQVLPNVTVTSGIICFFIAALLIFFPHDTLGGSDQAVYSNYAFHLAQTSSLRLPSYLNNLPDKGAENTRQYPPGYSVWLASQQSFFGLQGLVRGNLILIILGIFSLFLVSSFIIGKTGALATIILFSSCMPFLWFSRETMSENLMFFLLWSLILFLFISFRTKSLVYLAVVVMCSWLLAITRLEGFLLQFILVPIVFFTLRYYKIANLRKIFLLTLIFILVILSTFFIAKNTFGTFLGRSVPAVTYYMKRSVTSALSQKSIQNLITLNERKINTKNMSTLYDQIPSFFAQMLIKYNFLLMIFSIFLVAAKIIITIKRRSRINLLFLISFVILLPEYYKLVSPGISIFDPWLYRRYMYALLPFGYISFYMLIKQVASKKLLNFVLCGLLVINIILSGRILFLKNNWLLIDKLNEITKSISQNDFIIIREKPLGDYYPASFLTINRGVRSAPSSILWQHDFLPENRIFNGVPYNKIFLLSAKDKENYPSFNIVSRRSVDVEYSELIQSCQLMLLSGEMGLADPYNIGILPLASAINYCSKPGNKIGHHKDTLYLYELVYSKVPSEL